MIRPDLDGLLLGDKDRRHTWLVFGGRLHKLSGEDIVDALFEAPKIKPLEQTGLDKGPDMHKGTCLARGDGEGPIYLLSIYEDTAKRHLIRDYESFKEFGFSLDKVVNFPTAVLKLVPEGCEVTGAMSRVGRW